MRWKSQECLYSHTHTHVSDETSRKKIKKGKISILSLQIFCNIAFFLIKHINLCSPNHFKHTHTHYYIAIWWKVRILSVYFDVCTYNKWNQNLIKMTMMMMIMRRKSEKLTIFKNITLRYFYSYWKERKRI